MSISFVSSTLTPPGWFFSDFYGRIIGNLLFPGRSASRRTP
jgi:hypothetical protein